MRTRTLLLAASLLLAAVPAAPAATLTLAGTTLTYTGVATGETVTVESTGATSVKYFDLVAGQIAAPLPAGCAETAAAAGTQIVLCSNIPDLDHLSLSLGGGDDMLKAGGLSKETDISGGPGADKITGGSLADAISGDGGIDVITSGNGADAISSRDGLADTINCGNAIDGVVGDTNDKLTGCENQDLSAALIPDVDGDGYEKSVDCNDANPTIHPGATDTPGDGIDQDCSGSDALVPASVPAPAPAGGGAGTGAGAGSTAGTGTAAGSGSGSATTGTTGPGSGTTPSGTTGIATTTGTTGVTTTGTREIGITTTTTSSSGSVAVGTPIIAALPTITFRVVKARGYTRATKFSVAPVPAGATVVVRCKGRGCPAKGYRRTFKNALTHLLVRSTFDLARLRPGATLEIRVTRAGVVGRAARYTVNARSAPDAEASCLAPAGGQRTSC